MVALAVVLGWATTAHALGVADHGVASEAASHVEADDETARAGAPTSVVQRARTILRTEDDDASPSPGPLARAEESADHGAPATSWPSAPRRGPPTA
jgi:hypothetical protein